MSDDRLFATNTPIGRKWYYLNLLILSGITTVTYFFFTKKVIPGIEGADHITIANWILYFFLFYVKKDPSFIEGFSLVFLYFINVFLGYPLTSIIS